MRRRLSEVGAAAWRALTAIVGVDELLVGAGLVLVTMGLWSLVDRAALIAPGLVLLWIAVPQRTRFVAGGGDKRQAPQGGA